jgi:hypothetical protein
MSKEVEKEKIFVTTEAGERVVAVAAITLLDWSEKEVVDEDDYHCITE